ncbi:MAG: endonuclease domain-containing protein [Candidatus Moranbacteria bacterium]|nr:endonuclease domain-containing protein [Candidatus Moranbacteria bacterium]NTW90306.1 endonuclease domain-containing protein [Candidatus Moranbacteria bacterium]
MKRIFNSKSKEVSRKVLRKKATSQEVILWSRLRRNALEFKFRRQHSIGPYIVDFYCPEKKLVIELDGWQHGKKCEYDAERTVYLESLGLSVLRFWNDEVNGNLDDVVLNISEHLK